MNRQRIRFMKLISFFLFVSGKLQSFAQTPLLLYPDTEISKHKFQF